MALDLLAAAGSAASPGTHGTDAAPVVLLLLAFVLVAAKLAGELAERLGQPAVLGELLVGVVLGNAALVGGPDVGNLAVSETFTVLAELGAVLLLFQVGLESTPRQMLAVGGAAARVAVVGVVTPMLLGFGLGELLRPRESWLFHAFLGAMLAATSVGITARVLKDAHALRAPFARIILGAAVLDDVLGLLVLAVASGFIKASAGGATLAAGAVVLITAKALLFLVGAVVVGSLLSPRVFRGALALRSRGVVQALSLGFCFLLSYLAALAGLAAIVGAFAAGLVLEEVHFEGHLKRGEPPLAASLEPLIALLVPVFFVRMGMLVDLRALASLSVLAFAALLTLAAIIGKLACGLVTPKGVPRLAVGFGMMPRGEVGLIFAGIGAQLLLQGHPVVDAGTYGAAVFMVLATTMATPPLLLWRLGSAPGTVADEPGRTV
ncbi:MAG TPA: cation:proton antiporter [Vicinamibacteria bacterium]|nr:cation:proton antiporter [Vicinamibacteria bacterium]